MRRIFEDKEIDAVTIATTNHWHTLTAIWAMQAGKDVYVEKPVSHNIWEGGKLVETARKYNRIAAGGTQRRWWGRFRKAIELIHARRDRRHLSGELLLSRTIAIRSASKSRRSRQPG